MLIAPKARTLAIATSSAASAAILPMRRARDAPSAAWILSSVSRAIVRIRKTPPTLTHASAHSSAPKPVSAYSARSYCVRSSDKPVAADSTRTTSGEPSRASC